MKNNFQWWSGKIFTSAIFNQRKFSPFLSLPTGKTFDIFSAKELIAMPNISISVTEHEKKQMEDYAEMYGASISDTLKSLFFDRIKNIEYASDKELFEASNILMEQNKEAYEVLAK